MGNVYIFDCCKLINSIKIIVSKHSLFSVFEIALYINIKSFTL